MKIFTWKLACLILFFFSCSHSTEKKSSSQDSVSGIHQPKEKKYFSGSPDIPLNSFTITSAGIGPILLGDSLEKLERVFSDSNFSVSKLMSSEDGKEWPAVKLSKKKNYVIAECVNTVNLISVLRTNDPDYKTINGIHAGMNLDSLANFKDSIYVNVTHKTLMYGRTGVWFKLDNKTEHKYFLKGLNNEALSGGKIEELIIFCGDC
jgi:hypothetical protein